jgi:uncharacterized repeat protein (TIGR01451 family)
VFYKFDIQSVFFYIKPLSSIIFMQQFSLKTLLVFIILVFQYINCHSQVYYVDKNAKGNNDGTTWQHAFTSLNDALEQLPDNSEIWVAKGEYIPNSRINQDSVFKPKNGMKLYGGFNGTEKQRELRNIELYKTILTGEASSSATYRNIFSLIEIKNKPDTIIIDGFSFTGKKHHKYAQSISIVKGNLKVQNCDIVGNDEVVGAGVGGLSGDSSYVKVINTKFRNNRGTGNRSLYFNNSNLSIEGCSFLDDNTVISSSYLIYFVSEKDSIVFNNCLFSGNFKSTIYLYSKYSRVSNCTFLNNKTDSYLFYGGGDSFIVENSKFEGNSANTSLLYYARLNMKNTQVVNNQAVFGLCFNDSTTLSDCHFENNQPTTSSSGFIYTMNADFKNCTFKNNHSGGSAATIYSGQTTKLANCTFERNGLIGKTLQGGALLYTSLYAEECTFKDNYSENGAALFGGTAIIKSSTFDNNRAKYRGGAIYCHRDLTLENSIFTNNHLDTVKTDYGKEGGAIYVIGNLSAQNSIFANNSGKNGSTLYSPTNNDLFFRNCTFYNNFNNTKTPNASIDAPGNMVFRNSILWDKGELFTYPDSADVQFSILKKPFPGIGNINQDPQLDLNFTLSETSPAIDAGTPSGLISWDLLPTDIHRNARVVNSRIDIGASESQIAVEMNIVTGKVYGEFVNSCSYSPDDSLLAGIVLIAEPGKYYAATDENGQFSFQLPAGKYTISPILPKGKLIQNRCTLQSTTIDLQTENETVSDLSFFFYLLPQADMRVQVSQSLKRPCMTGTSKVVYWNEGTIEAKDVSIKMSYPNELETQVIPIANIKNKNNYTFFVGNVKPGEIKEFTIEDSVKCIVPEILGNSACINASISPYYTGNPGPDWDLSEVALQGECSNDSVKIEIINIGSGSMSQSSNYRVFLNDTLIKEDHFLIPQHGSVKVKVPTFNKVVRIEADQVKDFPFDSKPSLIFTNCGNVTINDKLKYSVSADINNAIPYKNTSCQLIRGAYDPNDKNAVPRGRYNEHLIPADQNLEYRINFQNTGNDTAFAVVLRDTISQLLDISTLRILSSSHPYSYTISGKENPVITFSFNSIMLPDSNANEPESHGYVIFMINPIQNISQGSIISNRSHIYFDYNPPIVTNTTFHTIGSFVYEDYTLGEDIFPEIITGIYKPTEVVDQTSIIYPNPVKKNDMIHIRNVSQTNMTKINLKDLNGRTVLTENISTDHNKINAPQNSGIYIYEIQNEDGTLHRGKIMIQE